MLNFGRLFDKTTNLLHRALDLRGIKHQASISNIANQETPFYKAKEMDFKRAIRDFLPLPIEGPMSITNKSHFSFDLKLTQTNNEHIPIGGHVFQAESYIVQSQDKTTRLDENNVSIEQEMATMAENNLMFNASSQMISGKFLGVKSAIRGEG
jgi:flagellar basal-body rod protein FlgB